MKGLRQALWWVLGCWWGSGALAQDAARPFHTVLVAQNVMAAARRVPMPANVSNGVATEVRLAERVGAAMRLTTEWLVTFHCQASPWRMAVWRKHKNVAEVGQPVLWVEQINHPWSSLEGPQGGPEADPVPPVWDPPESTLQLPTHWQAAAAFVCGAHAHAADDDAARAMQANLSMGWPDVLGYGCPLQDRQGRPAGKLALAFSPSKGAVRVNDKWVPAGVLDDRFLAFALDGVDFRFMRDTAVLRMVHRDEMQSLASARCVLESKGGQAVVKTGW